MEVGTHKHVNRTEDNIRCCSCSNSSTYLYILYGENEKKGGYKCHDFYVQFSQGK